MVHSFDPHETSDSGDYSHWFTEPPSSANLAPEYTAVSYTTASDIAAEMQLEPSAEDAKDTAAKGDVTASKAAANAVVIQQTAISTSGIVARTALPGETLAFHKVRLSALGDDTSKSAYMWNG